MLKQWVINNTYLDTKRNATCILVAITPYKLKSGNYLDFRYVNTSKHIRQHEKIALSRFETVAWSDSMPIVKTSNGSVTDDISSSILVDSAIGAITGIMPTKTNTHETIVSKRYDNVIYVDFVKRCIIL